jgi:uncharacterized RmlC-like cupin family protein
MSTKLMIACSLLLVTAVAQGSSSSSLPEMRMTPSELKVVPVDKNQIGSSKLAGVHTKVVYGDPSKSGLYSILLFVPPKTTIAAHSHRDDRVATVVTGTWHFGYGDHFDATRLKTLAPGSVYSEPAADDHFAQSGSDEVVVSITGFGPTDTHYFDPKDEPHSQSK